MGNIVSYYFGECFMTSEHDNGKRGGNHEEQREIPLPDVTESRYEKSVLVKHEIINSTIIELIPGAFYLFDRNNKFVWWNAFERDVIVGKSEVEMREASPLDTIHPDDRAEAEKIILRVMESGVEDSSEFRVLLHGGPQFRWFQVSGKRIFIDGNPFLIGVAIDINDRKEFEVAALRRSESRFRKLFDNHSSVMLVIDDSGNIVDANLAAEDFYGWSNCELCRMRIDQITTKLPEAVESDLQKFRTRAVNQFMSLHRRADGSVRNVDVVSNTIEIEGNVVFYCIINDVTERKLAESQLRKLSAAIEQSPAVVIITNVEGNIEYVNPKFTQLTGYALEEVLGFNPRILKSGLMPIEIYRELWETILSGRVWRGEMQNKKKNGDLFWQSAAISSIRNEAGVLTNFVAVNEDITEQKEILRELVAAKEKAEESDRLKSAFLANISHEIRTPMNGIMGFSELLKEPHLSGEEQSEYIGLIQQSGMRMLNLITDLMDISRIDARETKLHVTETSVNELLDDLFAFFKVQAEAKGLQLQMVKGLVDSESIVETDSLKLNQVLTNLLQNALKFTKKGKIDFGYTRKNEMLEFYVADSGIGIPVEMKDIIFERFHQIDNSLTRPYEGAGLGLSISRAFVEMLGGTLCVESETGTGSTFLFSLPYRHVTALPSQHSFSLVQEPARSLPCLTILVAEDDEVSSYLLKKTLENENISLLFAVNGLEAVALANNHPEINLVLMDIKMPVMNGFEATKKIKLIRADLPVIAQTAFTSKVDREKAKEAGCDAFVTKPVSKKELLAVFHELGL